MSDKEHDPPWPAVQIILAGLFTIVFAIFVTAFIAQRTEISGAVATGGIIESDRNRVAIQHPSGGLIQSLYVQEGSNVDQGDPLLGFDVEDLNSQASILENQLLEVLARSARLESERDGKSTVTFPVNPIGDVASSPQWEELKQGQLRLFLARQDTLAQQDRKLSQQHKQIGHQISGLDDQIRAGSEMRDLILSDISQRQTLVDRGLAAKSGMSGVQRDAAEQRGLLGTLYAQRAQAVERQVEIEIEQLKLGIFRREDAITELRDLNFRQRELTEQYRAINEQRSRAIIYAPVTGVIHNLQGFTERSVVKAGETMMYVVPDDVALIVTARILPRDITRIFQGQNVNLRVRGLKESAGKQLNGKVSRISADVFADEAAGNPYYQAEIVIPKAELSRLARQVNLVPGMPIDVFIITENRTVLAYLTAPLRQRLSKALRED